MNPMAHPIRRRPAARLGGLPGALLGTLLIASLVAPALADGDPTTDTVPRLLPYEGVLERDGQRVDAHGEDALTVLFALYDGRDAAQPAYRQPLRIEVYDGSFTTAIGPVGLGPDDAERAIVDVIAAADALFLGMTLLGDPDDPADDIPLAGRQPIQATPYALWTTSATDISVAAGAQIDGELTIGGAFTIGGSLQVEGDAVLPAGVIDSAEIADGGVLARNLDGQMVGEGLNRGGGSLSVDGGWLDGQVRSVMRTRCKVFLGWRNGCNNCDSPPAKQVEVRADGVCTGANGADTRCRSANQWGGVNTDGAVSTDDVFYIRLICS